MLRSPEGLIADISYDRALPFQFPAGVRGLIKAGIKDRPGARVSAELLDEHTYFYLPLHPPRMAMEYLERCGLLFAECTKLRDRIEALQLDIFNLKQSVESHTAELTKHRPRIRALWLAEEKRLKAQRMSREAAQRLVQANAVAIDDVAKKHPPKVNSTADETWLNVQRLIDKNRLNAELVAENAALFELTQQAEAALSSQQRTEAQWEVDDNLHSNKIQMLGVGGGLALETRLAGALHRYASLMNDLKEYMFSAEWGLEHVFGAWRETPWGDLQVNDYADENMDVPLDWLGERLIRLSNAAYGFQMREHAFAVSVRVDLEVDVSGKLVGTVRLPLPDDTRLAFVRRIRVRGPLVDSAMVELSRTMSFATQADREMPEWLTRDATPDELATWRPVYAAAIQNAAAESLADMSSAIIIGKLCSMQGDIESYAIDRTMSYTQASGDWQVTVSSSDNAKVLAEGIWLDVITSRIQSG